MKICLITLSVFSATKKGGGERYVSELTRSLRRKGHIVELFVVSGPTTIHYQDSETSPLVKVSIATFLRTVARSDLMHVHQLNSFGFDLGMLAKLATKKPLVLTDHGGGSRAVGRVLGGRRLAFVDGAAYVSEWSRQDVDPHGKIPRSSVVFGGGDHLPPPAKWSRKYDFGFVGRLLPHKGVHIAIAALPPNRSLVIAGQVRDAAYRRELDDLSVGRDVTFCTDLNDMEMAGIFGSIDYLLVPSVDSYRDRHYARPELLGLVALEALAAGVPVIGSNLGGLGELLKHAGQQVVTPNSLEDWSTSLAEAPQSPKSVKNVQLYSWDSVAEDCIELYDNVLSADR